MTTHSSPVRTEEYPWLSLTSIARVEATSAHREHPVGDALNTLPGTEWRAAAPGPQTIRVRFHEPRDIRRIRIVVVDGDQARTQEFTLSWWSRRGERHQVIVRQQFNFSPRGATTQVESYQVDLPGAAVLELRIVPDVSGTSAMARLAEFRVA
jgi:hypothetical protein